MHARVTRYEGGAPEAIDEALQTKKHVLPTEAGQTEDMKGVVFLADRQNGTTPRHLLGKGRRRCGASEDEGDARSRGGHRTRRDRDG